jgi:hypothetical protein
MCEQCDKRFLGEEPAGEDSGMPLEEAVKIAAGVRHRQDGTSQAFDALLRELDRLTKEKQRWDSLRGLPAEDAGCGA